MTKFFLNFFHTKNKKTPTKNVGVCLGGCGWPISVCRTFSIRICVLQMGELTWWLGKIVSV